MYYEEKHSDEYLLAFIMVSFFFVTGLVICYQIKLGNVSLWDMEKETLFMNETDSTRHLTCITPSRQAIDFTVLPKSHFKISIECVNGEREGSRWIMD